MLNVEIDTDSGFCFGVTTAIRKAEDELHRSGRLYCLGDIVHNAAEVERLRAIGLVTITHEELAQLHDVKVLLRAHGEPPSTYELARRNNIEIIDATCPVVLKLQQRIKEMHDRQPERRIVIYGKRGHAEVNGLVGQTDGQAAVVEDVAELDTIDLTRPVALYSQTTKSLQGFRAMSEAIAERKADGDFVSYDTICRSVANRIPKIRQFARRHDVIFFVSGAKSSNGKILFAECRSVNPRSYMVAGPDEVDLTLLSDARSVGICGATSTPRWLMAQVKERICDTETL